jgi:peptidoglycan biosynthesis protein MviN/MurJ (putative lipid II flippase)
MTTTDLFGKLQLYLQKSWQSPVGRSVLIVTFFTFGSRFLGFVRQFLILSNMDKLESDILLSANKIPEILSVVLLMGTVYSSVLPISSSLQKQSKQQLSSYLNLTLATLSAVLIVCIALMFLLMPQLLEYFTGTEVFAQIVQNDLLDKYILIGRILLLLPLTFASQAIWGVFLTINSRFLIYSMAGIFANLGSILAIALTNGDIVYTAIGMVLGGVAGSILYLIYSLKDHYRLVNFNLSKELENLVSIFPQWIQTWKLFLPRLLVIDGFYAASFAINPIVQNPGQVTAFDIATSTQGAFFIIVTSLGTVVFPDLSDIFDNFETKKDYFYSKIDKYLNLAWRLGFAVLAINFIGSPLIIWLYTILGKGQGTEMYIILLALVAGLSIPLRSVREILSRYIYVRQRQWQPLTLSMLGILGLVVGIWIGMGVFGDAGVAASIGFITYNLTWVIAAMTILQRDRKADKIN